MINALEMSVPYIVLVLGIIVLIGSFAHVKEDLRKLGILKDKHKKVNGTETTAIIKESELNTKLDRIIELLEGKINGTDKK